MWPMIVDPLFADIASFPHLSHPASRRQGTRLYIRGQEERLEVGWGRRRERQRCLKRFLLASKSKMGTSMASEGRIGLKGRQNGISWTVRSRMFVSERLLLNVRNVIEQRFRKFDLNASSIIPCLRVDGRFSRSSWSTFSSITSISECSILPQ